MKWGIIKLHSNEYREGYFCVRDYTVSLFGIPIYYAKFTSTNNEALDKLTILRDKPARILGFTFNK